MLVLLAMAVGCAGSRIPNTDIEDTGENRDVVNFVERYRVAVEQRNVPTLLSLVSERYFDDNGTPRGEDDLSYQGLQEELGRWSEAVKDVRYDIRYRRITFEGDKIYVDFTFAGNFQIATLDGDRWSRRMSDNRLTLTTEDGHFKIVSGL